MLKDKESGQSIIVITLAVIALLALVALVVDVGNAYAHRRMVQNAVDAAALAGARRLAERGVGEVVLEIHVLNDVHRFAHNNGVDPNAVDAWFIDVDGDRLETIDPWLGPAPSDADGVEVIGDLPFETYFAHLLGFPTMTASTVAKAWVLSGPCSGDNLFPITIPTGTFTETAGVPEIGRIYMLYFEKEGPGNWGTLRWQDGGGDPCTCSKTNVPECCRSSDCPQNSAAGTLGGNVAELHSGFWTVGDWVCGATGNDLDSHKVFPAVIPYVEADPWPEVIIPLYDQKDGTGANTRYRIAAFAAFRLRCVVGARAYAEHYPGDCQPCFDASPGASSKCIRGEFVRMVQPSGLDGCTDTGIYIPSFRKPRQ